MEGTIEKAEAEVAAKHEALGDPQLATDSQRLRAAAEEMEAAQSEVDRLYARWAELAAKRE